jgi:hypothetical protein
MTPRPAWVLIVIFNVLRYLSHRTVLRQGRYLVWFLFHYLVSSPFALVLRWRSRSRAENKSDQFLPAVNLLLGRTSA